MLKPSFKLIKMIFACLLIATGAEITRLIIPSIAPAVVGVLVVLGIALLIIILFALIDALRTIKHPSPTITREIPAFLALNQWSEASLSFELNSHQALSMRVMDHIPEDIKNRNMPFDLQLAGKVSIPYAIFPTKRGDFSWIQCEINLNSPLKLWSQRRYIPCHSDAKVYPDFKKLFDSRLIGIQGLLQKIGSRTEQRRGTGSNFHQLRDFIEGDTLKRIDWKATAKRNKPISKEYQDESNQQILFVLDCGQRMRTVDNGVAHFDLALNSSLLLAYIALKQDDQVGLMTTASDHNLLIKPGKGNLQLTKLLRATYNIETTQRVVDYNEVTRKLLHDIKRRSLIIFVTNLRYTESTESIATLKRLAKKHQILIASIVEPETALLREKPVHHLESALTYCGNVEYQQTRHQLNQALRASNIPIIETTPIHFTPSLINHYLHLKRSGAL